MSYCNKCQTSAPREPGQNWCGNCGETEAGDTRIAMIAEHLAEAIAAIQKLTAANEQLVLTSNQMQGQIRDMAAIIRGG